MGVNGIRGLIGLDKMLFSSFLAPNQLLFSLFLRILKTQWFMDEGKTRNLYGHSLSNSICRSVRLAPYFSPHRKEWAFS